MINNMSGFYFGDLAKKRVTTVASDVLVYGAKYPEKSLIEYNSFENDPEEKLKAAMIDIKARYGKRWGLWGEDGRGEFNVLNNLLSDTPPEGYKIPRVMANTKKLRFLYEWDNISLDAQKVITKDLIKKGVLQRAVFSGSKSIHHIIELWSDREPKTKEEYRFVHKFIAQQLGLKNFDAACVDSSRLTRAPQVLRKDKKKKQDLLYYSNENRFKCDDWYKYFLAEKKTQNPDTAATKLLRIIDSVKDLNKGADYRFVANYIQSESRKGSFNDGNRHNSIPRIVAALKLKGKLSLEEVQNVLSPYLEELDNQDLWNSLEKLYDGATE